jgi:hypothetical protein
LLVLLASLLAALFGRRMPAPLPVDAPLDVFSAGRAREHLERIARAPRPVGSPEHERVRAYLREALGALGLQVEEQRGAVRDVALANLLVRIPGQASSGTVLCLAHYDSVPTGPGAGDDGIGVVSWLEALRALRARGWRPRNDVLLLLSDGEELGLLGARLFAQEHGAAAEVRLVVNLEAIGNGGPAVLFQTGPRNGRLVREFARAVPAPAGTSLGDAVYRRMPNDTDLTVFLRRGIPGYNLALTAGSAAYHAPHDTPENLSPASVQHMGECALALVQRLGELDLARLDEDDATYFDLLGRVLVRHPAAWDAAGVALALLGTLLALILALRRGAARARELVRWLARFPLECALSVALVGACWWLVDRAVLLFAPQPAWVPGNYTSGLLLFAGLCLGVIGIELVRAGRQDAPPVARMLAGLGWWSAATIGAWLGLPGAGFALYWPQCLAALGLLLVLARERPSPVAELLCAFTLALAVLLGVPILHLLVQLFQRSPGSAVLLASAALAAGAGIFGPALASMARAGQALRVAVLLGGPLLLAAAALVARLLGWRQGSFLP